MQNTTQAPALVRGNGSKNETHTGDFWPVVTQTMVFNLQQNDCWPQLNKAKVSEGDSQESFSDNLGASQIGDLGAASWEVVSDRG